jgi:hypothetical protein
MQAMLWQYPKQLPVSVSILPAAWLEHGEELARICRRYPEIAPKPPADTAHPQYHSETYHVGTYTDEWGCVWSNTTEGQEAYVTGHPLPTRESVRLMRIPPNRDGRFPHGFMYLRLLDLRGFEEAMLDFAEEPPELQMLIDKVLEYNLLNLPAYIARSGEMLYFGDDLGMQHGLAIGAEKWRRYLKPAFQKVFGACRAAGKYVYMHTDGCIWEIMPDLAECGVNIINPQFRANGLYNLERICKGKIPINLDLDRQLFPFASPREIDGHVRECVEHLYLPQGGLELNLEIGKGIPLENIDAALKAVDTYRFFKAE